jgi:hypothetical protein
LRTSLNPDTCSPSVRLCVKFVEMDRPRNPYRRAVRWCALLTLFCVGAFGFGLIERGAKAPHWGLWFISAPLGLFALIFLLTFFFVGRTEVRAINTLLTGEQWVRWRYGAGEWRSFAEIEWTRDQGRSKKSALSALGGFTVVGLVVGWLNGTMLAGLALGVAAGLPFGMLVGVLNHAFGRATYRRRLTNPGEAVVGPGGVYQDGRYIAWRGIGGTLREARLVAKTGDTPAVVECLLRGRRGMELTVRVLVPAGHDEEAKQLVGRLS